MHEDVTVVSGDEVFAAIEAMLPAPPHRPLLVAVDGADGAGKTTLADSLATHLAGRGRRVVRASLDDFHHPQEFRHRFGRTGETVWARHFDYRAARRELLDPWLAGAGAAYRRRWHDVATDEYFGADCDPVPEAGVLLVDGLFAQRGELANAWDLVVYVALDDQTRISRMAVRDGSPDDLGHPDQRRYLDAQAIYRAACDPLTMADLVVDNSGPSPTLVAGEGSPGALQQWRREGDWLTRTLRLPVARADLAEAVDALVDPAAEG
ncbi:MAG: uridine kinase [Nocardioides sp.]